MLTFHITINSEFAKSSTNCDFNGCPISKSYIPFFTFRCPDNFVILLIFSKFEKCKFILAATKYIFNIEMIMFLISCGHSNSHKINRFSNIFFWILYKILRLKINMIEPDRSLLRAT